MNVFVISQACYDTTTCLWKGLVTLISLQKINTLKKQKDTERQVNAAEHLAAEETDISCWCWPELTSLPSYVRDTLILFKGTVRVIWVACLSDFRVRVRESWCTYRYYILCLKSVKWTAILEAHQVNLNVIKCSFGVFFYIRTTSDAF